jgi:hypothetical protein
MLHPLHNAGDHDRRGFLPITWQASSYTDGDTRDNPLTWVAVVISSRQLVVPPTA